MSLEPPKNLIGISNISGHSLDDRKVRDAWIVEQRAKGFQPKAIAEALHVKTTTVARIVSMARKSGLLPRYDQSQHASAVAGLSEDEHRRRNELILELANAGRTGAEIAAHVGLHVETIYRIVRAAKRAITAEASASSQPNPTPEPPAAPKITPGKMYVTCTDGSRVSLPCLPGEETPMEIVI